METDQPPPSFLALILVAAPQQAMLDAGVLISSGVILVILLLLSAVFSGSEVALFSLDPSAREQLAEKTDRASARVLKLLEKPRALLVSILVLNTVVNVAAAILAAIITHDLAIGLQWNPALTVVGEVIVLTFILLIVSEITPKLLASKHSVQFARRVSAPLLILHRMLWPISSLLAKSMQAFHGRFSSLRVRISGDDLKAMAEIGEAHGTIEEEERELIHSIVAFGDTSIREIMISRLDVVALPSSATVTEAVEIIRASGHSRLPLYVEHLDNILGIVYAKDLLRYMTQHRDEEEIDWTRLARPTMFVPLGKKLDDLLRDFQSKKTHIALVVDEYGGTAGVVTLEDVLEEIVGEIRDEHDESEEDPFVQLGPREFRFDAKIDLDELNEVAGAELDTEAFDFETLGGLIFHLAGEIPQQGDRFSYQNLDLMVESVESHRILNVLVTIKPAPETETAD